MTDALEQIHEARPRRFRPYPEYKDSGVEWLGEIPALWELKRLKHLAHIASGFAPPETYDRSIGDYPVYGSNGVIGYCDDYLATDETLAVGRVGASGSVNIVPARSWVSDNALLLRDLRPTARLAWLRYVLETMNLGMHAAKNAQPIITGTFLGNQALAAPHEAEQCAIATFLDQETAKIDGLVARKERLIELLQEKRTALITRAVTRGLDPRVPMKDSGVEWLGEIPAHWEVKPLTRELRRITYGFTNPMPESEVGPYMLTALDIGEGEVLYDRARHTTEEAFNSITDKSRTREGDLLLTKHGTLGRIAIADSKRACINQSVALLRFLPLVEVSFMHFGLHAVPYQERMIFEAGGTAIKHIYITRLQRMPFAFPSALEQRAIAAFLGRETGKIDALITKIREAIDRLEEFRTALISAAVTGKIDVREEAP